MADRIELKGVAVQGNHGVFDFEKRQGQIFITDVTVWTDFREAAATDDLTNTISYADIAETVHEVVAGPARDLIETVSSDIADRVVLNPLVHAVEVTVHKPDAPIEREFADVAVVARRNRKEITRAVLSLGSNVGDTHKHLSDAISWFEQTPHYRVVSTSSFYTTPPWGGVDQQDFLNATIIVETMKTPEQILRDGQSREQEAHRTREVHWGPRTLDVDIVTCSQGGREVHQATPDLTLPHPYAHQRAFVMVPWLEADPGATLSGTPLGEVLATLDEAEVNAVALEPGGGVVGKNNEGGSDE